MEQKAYISTVGAIFGSLVYSKDLITGSIRQSVIQE